MGESAIPLYDQSSVRSGDTVTITVGEKFAGDVVTVSTYSTPTLIRPPTVREAGTGWRGFPRRSPRMHTAEL
ncbi:hypothetical protein [Salinibacterium sp. TMP30]|uniref:hypothetical protein n=1 Tax=Salinibacterium sp. TMP30 TaxID=3138237 RepID=UPI0031392474